MQEQEEGEERESPRDSGPLLQEIVRASRTHLRDTRIRGKPWIGYIYTFPRTRAPNVADKERCCLDLESLSAFSTATYSAGRIYSMPLNVFAFVSSGCATGSIEIPRIIRE